MDGGMDGAMDGEMDGGQYRKMDASKNSPFGLRGLHAYVSGVVVSGSGGDVD